MAALLYQEIGRRLRRARENLGLSQEELARRLDYNSPTTVSNFESGERKISIADLQRVAGILGLPLGYFLGEGGNDVDTNYFRFRAREVRPGARKAVATFLSFAKQHGRVPSIPSGLSDLRPGKAAERVLETVSITEPPVMPQEIALRLSVPVYEWEFPDEISGVYFSGGDIACIGVNQAHPYVRQRFTVAHELGHLVFTADRDLFVDFAEIETVAWLQDRTQQALETKANQFAADLLMPRLWIQRDVNLQGPDVTLLARRYGVSEQALWLRLLTLKLVDEIGEKA